MANYGGVTYRPRPRGSDCQIADPRVFWSLSFLMAGFSSRLSCGESCGNCGINGDAVGSSLIDGFCFISASFFCSIVTLIAFSSASASAFIVTL